GNNQYWQASFNSSAFGSNEVIQYFLYLTFDGANGLQNSYLYGGDGASTGTANPAAGTNAPFTNPHPPAWPYSPHQPGVNNGTNPNQAKVDFWVKIGYLGKDDSPGSRWVDNARIYYTTDGSTPAGALGQASNTTQVAALVFNHPENNPSPAGDAMWWDGTV